MKKSELTKLIKEVILKEASADLKVGDHVYWSVPRSYMSPITISGVIDSIDGETATVYQTTQNTHGKIIKKQLNTLTKAKKQ